MVALLLFFVIVGVTLPSLIWLVFFLREDVHPEPKRLIFYTFAVGALSTIPALLAQLFLQEFFSPLKETLLAIIVFAVTEEIFKFIAAYLAVRKDPAFDEPIDAMIYMIAAALGFATVENLFVISNSLNADILSFGETTNLLLLRFVGATLLHVLASGIMGFYWAKGSIGKGLVVAGLIHAVFNVLILVFQSNNLLYASIFLILASFFLLQDFDKLRAENG